MADVDFSFTQADVDKLKRIFASGIKRVTYQGKTIEYRDMAEIEKALGSAVTSAAGDDPPTRQVRVEGRGGFSE